MRFDFRFGILDLRVEGPLVTAGRFGRHRTDEPLYFDRGS